MKKYFLFIAVAAAVAAMWCEPTTVANRDYEFEHYCDSVWQNDPDFYLDVVVSTDEYQQYIEEHGQWWAE